MRVLAAVQTRDISNLLLTLSFAGVDARICDSLDLTHDCLADTWEENERYDVLVMDCAGRGLEFATALRAAGRRLPVIFLSDLDDLNLRIQAARLGCAAFVLTRNCGIELPGILLSVAQSIQDGIYGD
jgi:DNA-binding response OmpR family regulator